MESSPELIVDLYDKKHPKYKKTLKNQSSPLFAKLPVETRREIIRLAVIADEYKRRYTKMPIRPQQVFRNSNKFHRMALAEEVLPHNWVAYDDAEHDELVEYWFDGSFKPAKEMLVAVALSRTCRALYHDLEHWGLFYSANTFEFNNVHSAALYLAAITPRRRAFIKDIHIKQNLLAEGGCGSPMTKDDYLLLSESPLGHRKLRCTVKIQLGGFSAQDKTGRMRHIINSLQAVKNNRITAPAFEVNLGTIGKRNEPPVRELV